MQFEPTRRLANGSIDYNFYHRRAAVLRAEASAEFFKGRRGVVRPLVAVAVIFAPLALAGLVNSLKAALPSATATSMSKIAER